MEDFDEMRLRLHSLVIFRGLLESPLIKRLDGLFHALNEGDGEIAVIDAYCRFASELFAESIDGESLSAMILNLALEDENLFTAKVAKAAKLNSEAVGLLPEAVQNELSVLSELALFDGNEVRKSFPSLSLPSWKTEKLDFVKIYSERLREISKKGFGIYAKYRMFILSDSGEVVPIKHPDTQRLCELYGYAPERGRIISNTLAFLDGKPANNVLLYGDAGTGKSSTVKAVVNEFSDKGLRLIELKKNQLYLIPTLMDDLAKNPLKFIIFIDDLTFASDDRDFCALKATLEGGVSDRGSNILIYATSNHRHLIKETYDDRHGDEISIGDKVQEIVSLSARFGLTVTFTRPDKDLYCEIVKSLADKAGVEMEYETLIIRAEAHAIRNGGRNPRTAKQFVDLLTSGVIV